MFDNNETNLEAVHCSVPNTQVKCFQIILAHVNVIG